MSYTPLHGFQSSSNNSTTPLASGATFTGTGEQNNVPDVMVSCFSDTAGTLYFDFSVDGTNWRTFPTDGFTVTASIHEFHIARKGPRYFRVRFVNSASTQTTFQLYTYFGWFGQAMAPIGFTIASDSDAIVTKSVISGVGDTTAKVTDHKALQVTFHPEGKSAFGEATVVQPTPIIQLRFPYPYVNDHEIESRPNQSGTVTAANSMLTVSTGAAANSSASVLSKHIISYRTGQGVIARYTGVFTAGASNSTQIIGIGDSGEGLFFGYNGANFGVLRRYGGSPEIRTLTITTASTTAEDVTVTLDGDAHTTVTVTNSGVISTTAQEVAAADYSDIGEGWKATAVGDTVVFTSWTSSSKTGAYSISGTTVVGTFAQTLSGAAPTEEWVAQTAWNGDDKFDGNGISGVTLDPTQGNVYQVKFQYLGFGAIFFYIEDPDDGEMHLVHTIEYANNNTIPSLDNPSYPLCMSATNAANTSDLTVSNASMAAFTEGKVEPQGVRHGIEAEITLGATSAETPILTVRSNEIFSSTVNRTKSKILIIGASADHTKPVAIKFYTNALLAGASFSQVDSSSTLYQDTSATAFSGGEFLFSIQLGRTGNAVLDLAALQHDFEILPGDSFTATIAPKSGNSAEATVSLYILEAF